MKKTIFSIIVLLALIGGVGYYGYGIILGPGSLSESMTEQELADIDQSTSDIEIQGLSDETVSDIGDMASSTTVTVATPATIADIDGIISDLNFFGASDTSGYNASLADL